MKLLRFSAILLTLLFCCFRFINLAGLPAQLNRDEAALAYNAFLLNKAGVDEWGKSWPLTLLSFGDYKLIGYPALLVALFKIQPASDLLVRLPSALAGLALLAIAWLWGKELGLSKLWRWLWLFVISTTPTFFVYSRTAYEANVSLFLLLASVWLMTRGLKEKLFSHSLAWWLAGFLLYIWSGLTYNTPLLIGPVLLIYYLWPGRSRFRSRLIVSLLQLIAIFTLTFLLWSVLTQKSGITIFNDETVWADWINWRSQLTGLSLLLFGNRYVYWLAMMIKHLVESFLPAFLVVRGGTHPWHAVVGWGHLLWPTYLLALVGWIKAKSAASWRWLIAASLLPSLVTVDSPHATRSLLFIFGFTFFAVVGLQIISNYFVNAKKLIIAALIVAQAAFFFAFLKTYFTVYPSHQAQLFQSGLTETLLELDHNYPKQKVAVQDGQGFNYILFAWYTKLDANTFLFTNIRQLPDTIGFRYGEQVGRFHFVGNLNDRRADETIGINWHAQLKQWQIQNFQ